MYLRLLMGLLVSLCVMAGCHRGPDDGSEPVEDPREPVQIKSTYPQGGATDFHYRNCFIIEFTDEIDWIEIELHDENGLPIEGIVSWNDNHTKVVFDPFGEDADRQLEPATDYGLSISWGPSDSIDPTRVVFSTTETGTPIVDPSELLVGASYDMDMSSAWYTEPPGVFGLMSQYLTGMLFLFKIVELDEPSGEIELMGASVQRIEGQLFQDLCEPTLDLTGPGCGRWDNPYLETVPTVLRARTEGVLFTVYDFLFRGSITVDGEAVEGGGFEGLLDTRVFDSAFEDSDWVDDSSVGEGITCELFASLNMECIDCPLDQGRFCIQVNTFNMSGTRVDVTSTNPETDELHEGLIEVTEEMVAHWTDLGFCPES